MTINTRSSNLSSDQEEAFDYLIHSRDLSAKQREWVGVMRAAFHRQGHLTERQIEIMENIARSAGADLDGQELFALAE